MRVYEYNTFLCTSLHTWPFLFQFSPFHLENYSNRFVKRIHIHYYIHTETGSTEVPIRLKHQDAEHERALWPRSDPDSAHADEGQQLHRAKCNRPPRRSGHGRVRAVGPTCQHSLETPTLVPVHCALKPHTKGLPLTPVHASGAVVCSVREGSSDTTCLGGEAQKPTLPRVSHGVSARTRLQRRYKGIGYEQPQAGSRIDQEKEEE